VHELDCITTHTVLFTCLGTVHAICALRSGLQTALLLLQLLSIEVIKVLCDKPKRDETIYRLQNAVWRQTWMLCFGPDERIGKQK